jgi:diguanylate cyclase (GGDEF)-like protein/PAS domain S-box-containing protein
VTHASRRPPSGLSGALLRDLAIGLVAVDWDGSIRWANPAAEKLVGVALDPTVKANIFDFLADPADVPRALAVIEEIRTRGDDGPGMAWALRHADGRTVHVEAATYFYRGLPFDGIVLQLRPCDPERSFDEFVAGLARSDSLETTLTSLATWLGQVIDAGVAIAFGREGLGFGSSAHFDVPAQLVGTSPLPVDLGTLSPGEVAVRSDLGALSPLQQEACADAGFVAYWALPVPTLGGGPAEAVILVWRATPGAPYLNHAGVLTRAVQACQLALAGHEHEATMRREARTDALTGAANRRTLFDWIARADTSFGVCYLDLDRFKSINDTHGHQHGDRALATVVARLRSALRSGDLLARIGGDEFVVLAPELDRPAARRLAQRLIDEVRGIEQIDGLPCDLGVSIGIAFSHEADSAQEVLDLADRAMYRAKQHSSRLAFSSHRSAAGHGITALSHQTLPERPEGGAPDEMAANPRWR